MTKFILGMMAVFAASGCASVGTVVIRSEPSEAQVFYIDPVTGQNALIGKTPVTFEKSTKAGKNSEVIQLRIEKEGFESKYSAVAAFGGETTFMDVRLPAASVAQAELRKAFETSRVLLQEANRLVLGQKYSEALVRSEKMIELDPRSSQAHSVKGSILYLMQDLDGARNAWTKALELSPGDEKIRAALIDLNLRNVERSPAQEATP